MCSSLQAEFNEDAFLMRVRFLPLGLLSIFILSAGLALGQITSGDFAGTVKDASGAVIANATVVATNVSTGVVYKGVGSDAGELHLANLPAGDYNVSVSANGFETYTLKSF